MADVISILFECSTSAIAFFFVNMVFSRKEKAAAPTDPAAEHLLCRCMASLSSLHSRKSGKYRILTPICIIILLAQFLFYLRQFFLQILYFGAVRFRTQLLLQLFLFSLQLFNFAIHTAGIAGAALRPAARSLLERKSVV